jgi:hypothetical protein
MKKKLLLIGLCLVLGAVLVAGCLGDVDDTNDINNGTPFLPPEPVDPPAGTAMYRGNVTNIDVANNTITLAQVGGTNFGAANISFVFDDNSRMNFNLSDLRENQYVEVFFGGAADQEGPVTAIAANLLQYANLTVHNGEILSVSTEFRQITVRLENNSTMIFNYDDQTQFYMNMADLTTGTMINVLTGGIQVALSEPPQMYAAEVRPFFTG